MTIWAFIRKVAKSQGSLLLLEHILLTGVNLVVVFASLRHWGPYWAGVLSKSQAVIGLTSFLAFISLDLIFIKKAGSGMSLSKLLPSAVLLRSLASMAAFALALGLYPLFEGASVPEMWSLVGLMAGTQILTAMNLYPLVFMVQERIGALVKARVVITVLFALLKIVALKQNWTVVEYQTLFLVEALFGLSLMYAINNDTDPDPWSWPSLHIAKDLFKEAMPFILSSFLMGLFFKLDIFLISPYLSLHDIGLYTGGLRVMGIYTAGLLVILGQMYIPLSRLTPHSEEYRSRLLFLFRIAFFGGLSIALLNFLVFRHIIVWILGDNYTSLLPTIGLLCFAIPVILGGSIRGYAMAMENLGKWHTACALVGIVALVAGMKLLVPIYGLMGATAGLLIAYVASGALTTFVFKPLRHLGWAQFGFGRTTGLAKKPEAITVAGTGGPPA